MNDLVLNLWPGALELTAPLWLLALPLALLPLWPRRRHSLDYGCIDWLPRDPLGNAVLRGGRIAAALAIVAAVLGLAGLAQPTTEQQRTGRGAEIVIVLDRSRSMDEPLLPKGRQPSIDTTAEAKGKVARRLLAEFAARRPEDRYSLLLFSSAPMLVVPFTQHGDVVQAGIEAGGIGRGLSETDIGRALLAGAEQFDRRAYSGSRILLLVSDGAAQIDEEMRGKIRRAFERNRVAVYWVFIRSALSLGLNADETDGNVPEAALHKFLQSTGVPYEAFEAEDPEAVKQAVAEVDRQQNLPLDYVERIPRRDFSGWCFVLALLAGAIALACRLITRPAWKEELQS
ncbi:MAG: vWA domain-containing protein [Methyloversatilis sp.]|jgi:mxaC protein|nr:vWA domain-containing protein [Methyloversatilis sp.]